VRGDEWSTWRTELQQEFLDLAVEYWLSSGFPYYELSKRQIHREWELLCNSDPDRVFRGDTLISSGTGLRLANYFHPQMWHVRCTRYFSPYETFSNPAQLRAAICKSMRIWPDRYGARGTTVRRMIRSFSNTVGVSNFRPTAGRAIIHKYSPPGGRVLDFSAGYGGRLLGALTLGRHYVGIDPSEAQVRGLRAMSETCLPWLPTPVQCQIRLGCAENLLPAYKDGSFDLVFSSPPYFDRERYGEEAEQSFIRFPTLDLWLDGFLRVVLLESSRVLRKGGWLVLNIGRTPESLTSFVQECLSSVLHLRRVLHLQLAQLPYKRESSADAFKFEPMFVFEKA
jgi:SAM-dependent methyltransferase